MVLLDKRKRDDIYDETLEGQRAVKRQLILRVREGIQCIGQPALWERMVKVDALDAVSRDSLIRLQAATDSLKHFVKDTLLVRPDYATQT